MPSLMADVCEHIRARRGSILERFKEEVGRLGLLGNLPEPQLVDDLDELLDRLCCAIAGRAGVTTGPSAKHAEVRWQAGVDIGALVQEYGVLAGAITEVLAQDSVTLDPYEVTALAHVISHAAAISVQEYAKFRDAEYAAQVDALRAAEAVRDALILDAPLGVAFLDRDLRFRLINEHLARINGVSRAAHIGHTPHEILPDVPAEFLMNQGREAMETGEARRDIEVTGETPAAPGVQRVWMEHWYPVRAGDDVIGVGVIVEEVTERKRTEAFRDRLLGVVSHDLRNPLNSIVMSANLVLMQPDVTPSIAGFTRRVLTSARRMTGIVDQLFDYVSVDQGSGLPLSRKHMDLGALTRRVVDESTLAFPGRPQVELRAEGDLVGDWDEGRLGQVLSNLIANAIQHGTGPATVRVWGDDELVHIEVRNHGKPIPPDQLESIFQPFKGSGDKRHLGLGLFISREVVRAHGGRIDAASDADATVFTIVLPRGVERRATA